MTFNEQIAKAVKDGKLAHDRAVIYLMNTPERDEVDRVMELPMDARFAAMKAVQTAKLESLLA